MKNAPQMLIIGLDGAGPDLLNKFSKEQRLPNITKLLNTGIFTPLQSTIPPTTLPAWTSFFTGAAPSSHGMTDFTVKNGYSVKFIDSTHRCLPTIFKHLENCGLKTGVAWFPATWPPEKLKGYQISGWDSPVTTIGDKTFVHPHELNEDLFSRFGNDYISFDESDEFKKDESWYLKTTKILEKKIEKKTLIAKYLLKNRPVDVAAFYFGETDTVAHHYWAFFDKNSPRHPSETNPVLEKVIPDIYKAIDKAVGTLVEHTCPDTKIILLSDHGSAGASDTVFYINRALQKAGLLSFKKKRNPYFSSRLLRNTLPGLIPASMRRKIFHFANGITPSILESKIRFGHIDWENTIAFSEEISYAPSIWINLKGREPAGIVEPEDYDQVVARVKKTILSCVDLAGSPLVEKIITRDELHRGKHKHLFPDLILLMNKPDGYTPVCFSSDGKPGNTVEKLPPEDHLGPKGRSMPGCHSENGILIVNTDGKLIKTKQNPRLEDVAPLITRILNVEKAPWFEGKCPFEIYKDTKTSKKNGPAKNNKFPDAAAEKNPVEKNAMTLKDERIVSKRLKRLGYL